MLKKPLDGFGERRFVDGAADDFHFGLVAVDQKLTGIPPS
jgi:hypothetical protein